MSIAKNEMSEWKGDSFDSGYLVFFSLRTMEIFEIIDIRILIHLWLCIVVYMCVIDDVKTKEVRSFKKKT